MQVLVVSDFHLGKGRFFKNGSPNILEDFMEDERFQEFLEYYSTGKNYWASIHLVLNGDIFNLIQIDVDGIFSHIVDETYTIRALELIYKGHKSFFKALQTFLQTPNKKISYVIGNHDAGFVFEGAQTKFQEYVMGPVDFCHELLIGGLYIEHGHRFEAVNTVPKNKYVLDGPNGTKILNLPWGSLFCVSILPRLKKSRPYIDRVRPFSAYVKWCFLHDTFFFFHMIRMVLSYMIKSVFEEYGKYNRSIATTLKMIKQVTIYPKYGAVARSILKQKPYVHTIVFGHTHLQEWQRYPQGRYYFNCGTWNLIPSIDASLHESSSRLTYVAVDLHPKTLEVRETSLKNWQGKWRPYRDEVSTAI